MGREINTYKPDDRCLRRKRSDHGKDEGDRLSCSASFRAGRLGRGWEEEDQGRMEASIGIGKDG